MLIVELLMKIEAQESFVYMPLKQDKLTHLNGAV
jgi:hypothetical protein